MHIDHCNPITQKPKRYEHRILPNRKKDKRIYYYDYGRGPGKRPAVGVFTYTKPQNQTQKNHNKQVLDLLNCIIKRVQDKTSRIYKLY